MHVQVAGGGLGGFDQVFQQPLQFFGLALQHVRVFRDLFASGLLFSDQIRIVDDGRERRLDVVTHVGDEFCLKTFALQLCIRSFRGSDRQTVEIFPMLLKIQHHAGRIDLIGQVPFRQRMGALLELAHLDEREQQHRHEDKMFDKPEDKQLSMVVKDQEGEKLDRAEPADHQQSFPDQGDVPQEAADRGQCAPDASSKGL